MTHSFFIQIIQTEYSHIPSGFCIFELAFSYNHCFFRRCQTDYIHIGALYLFLT